MKLMWLLLVDVVGFVMWNRSCNPTTQIRSSSTASRVADSRPGGPVRQIEQQPRDLIDMNNAMPSSGGGSTKAMLDTARGAQK